MATICSLTWCFIALLMHLNSKLTKHTKLGFPNDKLQSNLVEYLYFKKKQSNVHFLCRLASFGKLPPGTQSVLAYCTFKFKFSKEKFH